MRRLTNGTERCSLGTAAPFFLLLALLALPASAGAATAGGLRQLGSGKGCFANETPAPSGCTGVRGMTTVGRIAISPDGKNVYVPSKGRNAVAVFDRDAGGALKQKT